ncbi:DUF485 domain-containing protein [Calditerricola satsumensis]|uniref:Membrane protein n=1 Tax=Calditerricola satsumensis TaxID=373054 RepID=A0A8J3B925_9BACI|nr:DUF485 domain-containing protein [Calditerricola satsumensis]GGK03142.1 membrane protein [Calditerricola satsumensis]
MNQNARTNEGHEPLEAKKPGLLSDREWEEVARDETFRHLVAEKKRFIVPATIFFLVYYFTFIVMIGFFKFLNTKIFASVNWAHVFALSQFFMAWTIAILYARKASRFDQLAASISQRLSRRT